ncbi:MAG: SPOR domain-containing protein [Janthinobacterium lividum]
MTSKNLVKTSIAMLVVISVAIFLYIFSKKSPREIPIIYPDNGETRIKPLEIGGIIIPNSENTIYESLTGSSTRIKKSAILSEPEQPIIFEKHQSLENEIKLHNDTVSISGKRHDRQEINNINDSESIFDNELITIPSNQLQKKLLSQRKTLNIIKYNKESGHKIGERIIEGNIDENYMIQLASVKSEVEGTLIGERIKRKYRKILESYSITLKKIKDKNGQFFYLVLAGNCPNISIAKAVCKKLAYHQQSCMIFKP